MRLQNLLSVFAILILPVDCARAENWPQFRGTAMNGVATSRFPTTWDTSTNIRWRVPLAGEGWSCPVVWGDRVFVTAAVRIDSEKLPTEEYRNGGGQQADLTKATYRWEVLCLDAKTGEILWRQVPRTGHPPIPRHSSNTYATETPVTDGERVYAYFGMTGLYCYDLDGDLQWQKDLGTYPMRADWGTSSSPVLLEDKLFVQVDNEQQSFVVALDTSTGDEVWRVERDERSQYSTPIIWRNSLRNELILGGQHYRSYDPETGTVLWTLDMEKGRSSAAALAVGDRLYVGTEFRNRGGADDGGGFLFSVKAGGAGEIAPPNGATSSTFVEWKIPRSGIQMASPVHVKGFLYLLERRSGMLHCVDAVTGEMAYRVRVPGARAFWASPWTDGERVYCLDDDGNTHVLASGPEFQLLHTNRLDELCWSSPAIANGALYLRTASQLYCIAERQSPAVSD